MNNKRYISLSNLFMLITIGLVMALALPVGTILPARVEAQTVPTMSIDISPRGIDFKEILPGECSSNGYVPVSPEFRTITLRNSGNVNILVTVEITGEERTVIGEIIGMGNGSLFSFGPTDYSPINTASETVYLDDIAVDGLTYFIDSTTGILTFIDSPPTAGQEVTIDYTSVSNFYTNYMTLNDPAAPPQTTAVNWNRVLAPGETAYPVADICVPFDYPVGIEPASIIFWTEMLDTDDPPIVKFQNPLDGADVIVGETITIQTHNVDDWGIIGSTFEVHEGDSSGPIVASGTMTQTSGTALDGIWMASWDTTGLNCDLSGMTHTIVVSATDTGSHLESSSITCNVICPDLPSITTQAVTEIGATTALGNGNITDLGRPNPIAHGLVWNTTGTPTLTDNSTDEGPTTTTGSFTSSMTSLAPDTTYYVRAYALNTAGTVYGNEVTFNTQDSSLRTPTVTTQPVTEIGASTARGNGTITDLGNPTPISHGFVWNISGTPTLADNSTDEGPATATGAFTSSITGLLPNTTYYVRAYATNTGGTVYGEEALFTTQDSTPRLPTITTQPASLIGTTTARGNGIITDLGNPTLSAHGMVWNTSGLPTLADNSTDKGSAIATGAFYTFLTGLTSDTTYYVRAYAMNAEGTVYGNEVTFTTQEISDGGGGGGGGGTTDSPPTVTTQPASEIGSTTAKGNGIITSLGSPAPTAHGVVWNTSGLPTLANNSTNEGPPSGIGAFTTSMTNLTPDTSYYVRAYAINALGTAYGNEVTFTTQDMFPGTPAVTTESVTDIGTSTATGNGTITDLGNPTPSSHGVVWNTSGTPTLADNNADDGPAITTGAFTSSITGLLPNTTYYVRAYAINTEGTVYGDEVIFATGSLPAVSTQDVTDVSKTTAMANWTITDLGNPDPTAHGVAWNILGLPTLADNSINEGTASATGVFTRSITDLSPNTTYYLRAYATNPMGTVYADEVSFITTGTPMLTTQMVTELGSTTATGNGTITNLGNPNPTAHGVVWNTSGTPTLAGSFTDEGPATEAGAFTSSITGLTANTTYYLKAYATNAEGTAYGDEIAFSTQGVSPGTPTVTTQAVTDIDTTAATGNGTIIDLGNPTLSAHGVVWNTSGTPTLADNSTNEGSATATGAFTSSMTGLTVNTAYYVRSYATNAEGTVYGDQATFITGSLPSVTTQDVTDVGIDTATGNGTITDLGDPNPTAHGIVWNTSGTPTLADDFTDEGPAILTGPFSSSITGLTSNTIYYVRAYATNDAGAAYGNVVSFTTTGTPTLTTQAVTELGSATATGNGTITDLGNPHSTAHGMVWNTSGTPTLVDNFTDNGPATATGAFSSSISGLTPNTIYYMRAYATNAEGIAYGNEIIFTTQDSLTERTPNVHTQGVTEIGSTAAIGNGSVTDLGNPTLSVHGMVWNISGTPTLEDNFTDEGLKTATGPFTSSNEDI